MTCWNVDVKKNEMFMAKCMNPRCTTGHIVDDLIECPDCGRNEVHITKHVHDKDKMGTSETRKMIRVENQVADHPDRKSCDVLFIEDNLDIEYPSHRPCMSHMMLIKDFASNAKVIRVTVEIIE